MEGTTGAPFSTVINESDQWLYVSSEQSAATRPGRSERLPHSEGRCGWEADRTFSAHRPSHRRKRTGASPGNHSGGSTLIRSAVAGDPEALGRLLSRLTDQLYCAAFRVLNSLGEAEDAVQGGLLAATRKLKTFEGRAQFYTWLTRA
jgi:hypothetical protein